MDFIRLLRDRDMFGSRPHQARNTMTENLFSHPAETEIDTTATTDQDSAEPVTMPVFSHLGK